MKKLPMRILHVVGAMNRAGAESMLMSLYRGIDRTRFQFDFLEFSAEESDFAPEIKELGGRLLKCRWSRNPIRRRDILSTLMMEEGPFAAVHSHILFASGSVLSAAKLAQVPVRIAHAHSTSDSKTGFVAQSYRALARQLIRRDSTALVACSVDAGHYVFGSDFEKVGGVVVPNSVDLEKFHPSQLSNVHLGHRSHQPVSMIAVARLEYVKNHRFLVELADELRTRSVDFVIKFVGQGSLEGELQSLIAERNLHAHVEMLGLRKDVQEIMRESDALLMPSLWEGMPVTLVEAQATGLPSLVSDRVTRDADLGLGLVHFLPIDSVHEWADAIVSGFPARPTSGEITSAMQSNGYTVESSLEKLMPIYLEHTE